MKGYFHWIRSLTPLQAAGMRFTLHVQENWDESVQTDVVNLLHQMTGCTIIDDVE